MSDEQEPQKLLPCVDHGEHRFTAITFEFEHSSGIQVFCTRCGIDRARLTPGWEEIERQDMITRIKAMTGRFT